MNKLKSMSSDLRFWIYFLTGSAVVLAIETILLGLWPVPIINYRIDYMAEISTFDIAFVILFALFLGFGISLFLLHREISKTSCAMGSSSGIASLFTLLCPVCPLFFLSYFGVSISIMAFAPYFWWIRLVASTILLIGIVLLWRKLQLRALPKLDPHGVFHKLAVVTIAILFINNQSLATQIGQNLIGSQPGEKAHLSGDFAKDVTALVTPTSLPFYGSELGLNFSNLTEINASIKKLGVMAPQQGSNPIELNTDEMKRYIAIGTEPTVTCEFCCGATTLVREDGSPTCGCAHSIAMRGTAAYLIKNYPQMTNAQIAYELMRQKGMYFPKQMQDRMAKQLAGEAKDFTSDIKYLTQNLPPLELENLQRKAKEEGFTPDVNTGMVGGC